MQEGKMWLDYVPSTGTPSHYSYGSFSANSSKVFLCHLQVTRFTPADFLNSPRAGSWPTSHRSSRSWRDPDVDVRLLQHGPFSSHLDQYLGACGPIPWSGCCWVNGKWLLGTRWHRRMLAVDFEMLLLHCICFGVIWISPCTDDGVVCLHIVSASEKWILIARRSIKKQPGARSSPNPNHRFWRLNISDTLTGFDCSPFHELNEPRKDDAHAEFLRSLASKEAGELWFTLFCQGVPTSWSCLESSTLETWQFEHPFSS